MTLQTDPIGGEDDLNLYAYVGGDPVNKSDPTGLADLDLIPKWHQGWRGNATNWIITATDSTFNPSGYFVVSTHGNPISLGGMNNSSDIANAIRSSHWDGKEIVVLAACNVGNGQIPAALAAELGVPVIAATAYVQGSLGRQDTQNKQGKTAGAFLQFNPNGTRQNPLGVSEDKKVTGLIDKGKKGMEHVTSEKQSKNNGEFSISGDSITGNRAKGTRVGCDKGQTLC